MSNNSVRKMENSKRNFGKEFEEEVKSFLEDKFNFKDVKGGHNFHIAPKGESNQTDVCGIFNDILFVFQCKAAGRTVKRNFRNEILATRERARIILKNYKSIPEYAKCKFILFIFITKKIIIPQANIELLEKGDPKIWYADEKTLEYYSDLHDKIGEYAVYNFLADFGLRPPKEDQISFTALRAKLNKYTVYSFFANPKELIKYSYVARRRSKKEDFYQRMLEKSRIKKIQNFIDAGGVFPTNVIISLKKGEKKFKKLNCVTEKGIDIGELTIRNSYNACWIIDGQHRLFSFSKSKKDNLISCIAFDEISIEEERGFFLEINREQKPIQPDLIWDLEGLAHPESPRGIISNIVRKLNFKEPFIDKIYIPVYGTRVGKIINMAAFCNGIYNSRITNRITANITGKENPLFTDIPHTMVNRVAGVLERYFNCLNESIEREEIKKFIFGNAGIPIMLYLLEPIIAKLGRIPSHHDFYKFADAINEYFDQNFINQNQIKQLREETTSEASRKGIAKQIGRFIRSQLKDKSFWPTMEEMDFVNEIILLERRIGKFISKKLSDLSSSWEKQRLPEYIYKNAVKKMAVDGTDLDENFDLGDELQIITRKDNWEQAFKNEFIKKDGFLNQDELRIAFLYLSKIRNPAAHGKSVIPTQEELNQCEIYIQKFIRLVPELITDKPQDDLI